MPAHDSFVVLRSALSKARRSIHLDDISEKASSSTLITVSSGRGLFPIGHSQMEIIEGETFSGESVELDDKHFINGIVLSPTPRLLLPIQGSPDAPGDSIGGLALGAGKVSFTLRVQYLSYLPDQGISSKRLFQERRAGCQPSMSSDGVVCIS